MTTEFSSKLYFVTLLLGPNSLRRLASLQLPNPARGFGAVPLSKAQWVYAGGFTLASTTTVLLHILITDRPSEQIAFDSRCCHVQDTRLVTGIILETVHEIKVAIGITYSNFGDYVYAIVSNVQSVKIGITSSASKHSSSYSYAYVRTRTYNKTAMQYFLYVKPSIDHMRLKKRNDMRRSMLMIAAT